jgi:hypothetical protein
MSEAGSRAAWEDVTHSTPFTFTQVFTQAVGIPIFQYTLPTYPIIEFWQGLYQITMNSDITINFIQYTYE